MVKSAEEQAAEVARDHAAKQAVAGYAPHPGSHAGDVGALDPRTPAGRGLVAGSGTKQGPPPHKPTVVKGVDEYSPDARGLAIMSHLHLGEPWFVFRAQDILSSFALETYLTLLEKFNPMSPQVESCTEMVNAFRRWQQANPSLVKLPD